jgi:hypothetical protein
MTNRHAKLARNVGRMTIVGGLLWGLAAPAQADSVHFEQALTGFCLADLPDMTGVPAAFKKAGWRGFTGAGDGEVDYDREGTQAMVFTGSPTDPAGCTVMDAVISKLEAKWLVELWLDKYHAGDWLEVDAIDSELAWLLDLGARSVRFELDSDPTGEGALVSFELR